MVADTLSSALRLRPEQLRRRIDPASLSFTSTESVLAIEGTIGQERALDAIEFGLEVNSRGYNLFVTGVPGSGRTSTILTKIQQVAANLPAPSDWVYVYNFADPDRPNAIRLPAGKGAQFAKEMEEFVRDAQREVPRAFESAEYERRQREALAEIEQQRNALFEALANFARSRGFTMEMTPAGIITVPLAGDRPITPQEFQQLPDDQRQAIEQRGGEVQTQVGDTLRQVRQLEKLAAERVRQLDREVALFVIGPLLDDLRSGFAGLPEAMEYIAAVERDLPEHLDDLRTSPTPSPQVPPQLAQMQGMQREEHLGRYRVNLLIDNSGRTGAPVIVERNPTYYNLGGRIDYRAAFGTMVADFFQIKAGALHQANGGFLVLHALEVLSNPFSWQSLKRALRSGEVQIENLAEQMSPIPTATIRPEAIPLSVKVVLLGPPTLFQLLYQSDEHFSQLFKVKADFAPDMDLTDAHLGEYVGFVSRMVAECELRHFEAGAVARVVEYGARLREHQKKLSTRLQEIGDIVTEASFWATKAGHALVLAEDVDRAIDEKKRRSSLLEDRMQEVIDDGTVMIDTTGVRVGQINGLSVLDVGDYMFGKPARITARVGLGRGSVVSVEREIELSGPIHSKGVLILSGYLTGNYAQDIPLAMGATITFEQGYGGVEGDSASSTELYALLSALADLPIKQSIAVTGSVNQNGEVQAVGGVTHKIEGFFATCKARGLTGDQGVIIPAANVVNLMLDDEVIRAVETGQFHVWAVRTINEGIELLTGRPAGERDGDGNYPEGSVHRRVSDRLRQFAEQSRSFGSGAGEIAPGHDGHAQTPVPAPPVPPVPPVA